MAMGRSSRWPLFLWPFLLRLCPSSSLPLPLLRPLPFFLPFFLCFLGLWDSSHSGSGFCETLRAPLNCEPHDTIHTDTRSECNESERERLL